MGAAASTTFVTSTPTARVTKLVNDAEATFRRDPVAAHSRLREAKELLAYVGDTSSDLAVAVYRTEGQFLYREQKYTDAFTALSHAIQLVELKVASHCTGLDPVLQQYTECMCTIARIVQMEADAGQPLYEPAEPDPLSARGMRRLQTRRGGCATTEMVLLRCVEILEEAQSRRSVLLTDPLLLLSELYERQGQINRAELFTRRIQGILLYHYGPRHPDLIPLSKRAASLLEKKEALAARCAARTIIRFLQTVHVMRFVGRKMGKKLIIQRLRTHNATAPRRSHPFFTFLSTDAGSSALNASIPTGCVSHTFDELAPRTTVDSEPHSMYRDAGVRRWPTDEYSSLW